MKAVLKSYRPTPWLLSGDQRTLAVAFGGGPIPGDTLREIRFQGPRGPLLLYHRPGTSPSSPTVLVLGGIVGDPDSPFIRHLQKATKDAGWGFALWVTRPDLLSGSLQSAPDPGQPNDIHACLGHLREMSPGAPLHLAGYSMGASMALFYCGAYGDSALCTGAVALSGSFTMLPLWCEHYRCYWQPWLTACLKLAFYERFSNELPPKEKVQPAQTYADLVDCLPHLGPTSKFADGSAPLQHRSSIVRPTLFVASLDDPFHFPVEGLGIDPDHEFVLYMVTETGGHTAWPEGWSADCSRFHTRVVLEFLRACGGVEGEAGDS